MRVRRRPSDRGGLPWCLHLACSALQSSLLAQWYVCSLDKTAAARPSVRRSQPAIKAFLVAHCSCFARRTKARSWRTCAGSLLSSLGRIWARYSNPHQLDACMCLEARINGWWANLCAGALSFANARFLTLSAHADVVPQVNPDSKFVDLGADSLDTVSNSFLPFILCYENPVP